MGKSGKQQATLREQKHHFSCVSVCTKICTRSTVGVTVLRSLRFYALPELHGVFKFIVLVFKPEQNSFPLNTRNAGKNKEVPLALLI